MSAEGFQGREGVLTVRAVRVGACPGRVGPGEGAKPEGWRSRTKKKWGPEGWGLEGPRRGETQKFELFSLSRHNVLSFFSLSWGSFRGILVVFEAPGPEMCTLGVLGLSCEAPAACTPRDFTQKWPNEAPTRTLGGIRPRTAFTINSVRRPTREESQNKNEGGRAKFWALRWRAEGGPAEGRSGGGCPRGGRSRRQQRKKKEKYQKKRRRIKRNEKEQLRFKKILFVKVNFGQFTSATGRSRIGRSRMRAVRRDGNPTRNASDEDGVALAQRN